MGGGFAGAHWENIHVVLKVEAAIVGAIGDWRWYATIGVGDGYSVEVEC